MINQANTAFVLISTILVFFMTPGLAFFYGGLVSKKNVVNTMFSVFVISGLAILLFVSVGYVICFGKDVSGIFGWGHSFFLSRYELTKMYSKSLGIDNGTYLVFQMMFSIITPALFVGAVVGRMRFNFLILFVSLWSIFVYYPMVHMVWSPDGLLGKIGMLDFAGGTVVHINAGITALVLSIFLGPRIKYNIENSEHYNLPWVLLGTSILWIGWYGFNVGSALGIDKVAIQAFLTTTVCTGASLIAWMILDLKFHSKPSLVGICTGALCGLVGITPAAAYVSTLGAIIIGVLCSIVSFIFVEKIKPKLKYDDPLDAFGCHGISGILGSILTGVFANKAINSNISESGLLYGGVHLFLIQVLGTVCTIIFVIILSTILVVCCKKLVKMRVTSEEELIGLDKVEHNEKVDSYVKSDASDVRKYRAEFRGQLSKFEKRR